MAENGTIEQDAELLFQSFIAKNFQAKNRLFRSSISGRIDSYGGPGSQACINLERRFAPGGVGTIMFSHVPVHIRGGRLPHYATIDRDERIPFWREVGHQVREAGRSYDGQEWKLVLQFSDALPAGYPREPLQNEYAGSALVFIAH